MSESTPLYHQIASEIRRRIAAGELQPGEALAPLREAAEEWGVHFHTVRHAYAALAREGLVESSRGPRGTRVAGGGHGERLNDFVRRVMDDARRRWSLDKAGLIAAIERAEPVAAHPVVYVVECSDHQCRMHAAEISGRWEVDARPWTLDHAEPPSGQIVATYFHYNDIRRRWPRLLEQVHFVTIAPGAETAVPDGIRSVLVCETDADTADTVAADVSRVLGDPAIDIETFVSARPRRALDRDHAVIFFSPRVWAGLPEDARRDRRSREIRYEFDRAELEALAEKLGWRLRARAQEVSS